MSLRGLPPTLTVEKAGQLLGVSRYAAYRAASTGEIPVLRLGRRLVVPTARLLAMPGWRTKMLRRRPLPSTALERQACHR
ncbi:MAG: helix-turn-helix domain-containing protein [Actinomycetota bacterium]|nr:helix-turn-helix domain-containing protein [Actinomycetota bacterium]